MSSTLPPPAVDLFPSTRWPSCKTRPESEAATLSLSCSNDKTEGIPFVRLNADLFVRFS